MTISFACPKCRKPFRVSDDMAGRLCLCQGCQTKLRVPAAQSSVAQPAAAPSQTPPQSSIWDEVTDADWQRSEASAMPLQDETPAPKKKTKRSMEQGGLWRDGDQLVFAAGEAIFPRRCLKTGQQGHKRLPIGFSYVPASSWLFGVAFAMLVGFGWSTSRDVRADVWLSESWLRRCRLLRWMGGLIMLLGIGGLAWGIGLYAGITNSDELGLLLIFGGSAVAIAGFLTLAYFYPLHTVKCTHVDEEGYAWIKGVHEEFLRHLPPWKG